MLLVANKVDDAGREALVWDFMRLGLGEPCAGERAARPRRRRPARPSRRAAPAEPEPVDVEAGPSADDGEQVFSVAIVGRPNVGKSTLFNRLIGEERAVVHDLPGTTRDSIDTVVETDRSARSASSTPPACAASPKIDEGTEYYSLVRALQAVDHADVALLVIDATEGVTAQDQRLAERIDVAGCPVVVLLNKWELLDAEARHDVAYQLGQRLHFLGDGAGAQDQRAARARACTSCCRRSPTRSAPTTGACRRGR